MKIIIKFCNHLPMEICVDDTETGRLYFNLTRNQNQIQKPFYRDTRLYTKDYMRSLAQRAKEIFGWEWLSDSYDISMTAEFHKDIENSVGQLGFDQIPQEHDDLIYELHHCLHSIQFGKSKPERSDNLQIEWLTDNTVPLPKSFEFVEYSSYGDLILINPYVGHNPLQIYNENDFNSLSTTCRFHDVIKPGIVIGNDILAYKEVIVSAFKKHDPVFVELHGEEKIRYYSGVAKIGSVTDTQLLSSIKNSSETLYLDKIEFYD